MSISVTNFIYKGINQYKISKPTTPLVFQKREKYSQIEEKDIINTKLHNMGLKLETMTGII